MLLLSRSSTTTKDSLCGEVISTQPDARPLSPEIPIHENSCAVTTYTCPSELQKSNSGFDDPMQELNVCYDPKADVIDFSSKICSPASMIMQDSLSAVDELMEMSTMMSQPVSASSSSSSEEELQKEFPADSSIPCEAAPSMISVMDMKSEGSQEDPKLENERCDLRNIISSETAPQTAVFATACSEPESLLLENSVEPGLAKNEEDSPGKHLMPEAEEEIKLRNEAPIISDVFPESQSSKDEDISMDIELELEQLMPLNLASSARSTDHSSAVSLASIMDLKVEKDGHTHAIIQDEESGIFSGDSVSSSASKLADGKLVASGKKKTPKVATRKSARKSMIASGQAQISIARPVKRGSTSSIDSVKNTVPRWESIIGTCDIDGIRKYTQKRSMEAFEPRATKRSRTSFVNSVDGDDRKSSLSELSSVVDDMESDPVLKIDEGNLSGILETLPGVSGPEIVVKPVKAPGKKRLSKKDNSSELYQPGQYPMERLAMEAFVFEGTANPVCRECLDFKFEDVISGALLRCQGMCGREVHIQCLKPGIHIGESDKTPETESEIADFRAKLIDRKFTCEECRTSLRECYLCNEKAVDLVKCPENSCGHFYHRVCLMEGESNESAELKPCPSHECHTCKRMGRDSKDKHVQKSLTKCAMCPMAFHFNFMCFPTEAEICIDNPKYHTCWKHIPPSEESVVVKKTKKKTDCKKIDSTICFVCHDGGELLVCQSCPYQTHADCAGLDGVPEGDWNCHDCVKGVKPMMYDIVWFKNGSYRVWPCQIVRPETVPSNVKNDPRKKFGNFIVQFLGTKDYDFAKSKHVLPYDICDPSWKLNPGKPGGDFRLALEQAKRLSGELVDIKSRFINNHFFGIQLHYNRIRANKVIPPAVYGPVKKKKKTSEGYEDDIYICLCKETDPDPCGPTSKCINRNGEMECHPKHCGAGEKCQNQRIRRRQYPKLKVFYTPDRGWALKTLQDLTAGDFVIEYVGEIITVEERNSRIRKQLASGNVNFYYLDLTKNRVIDAGPSGNDARFANHSCDPNSSSQKWVVDGETRIALIAIKDIKAGEEISFDYRWEYESGVTSRECLCRAENCQGKIGGKEKGEKLPSTKKVSAKKKTTAMKKRRASTMN